MKTCVTCKLELPIDSFSKFYSKYRNKIYTKSSCIKCRRESSRDLYRKNRQKYIDSAKAYTEENKDKILACRRVSEAKKRKDKGYRLRLAMYSGIRRALLGEGSKTKMMKKMQWSVDELIIHLESQFSNKMSWDNYGSYWQVDHIIPVSKFKYETHKDDDFKACWALSNLRPLCKIENIKKSNKLLFLT